MRKNYRVCQYLALLIIIFAINNLKAAERRMLGANMTMSWFSSYLEVQSGSITVQDNSNWTYGTAPGWFFDYLITPYVSFRTNWFFYPVSLNRSLKKFNDSSGQISLHEAGFSVLRHFNRSSLSPWIGIGPYLQLVALDDVNTYIIHAILSTGFDYELTEDVYFCPELMWGMGTRIIKTNENKRIEIDVPTGKNFSSSGIVIYLKLGVGKAF